MKTLNEMTELEILALTNSEVEKIIKYRKAQEGIKLLENPTEPEYEPEIQEDLIMYSVNNLHDFKFTDAKKAGEVASQLKELTKNALYARWGGNPVLVSNLSSYDRDYASFNIKEDKYFSPAIAETAKQINKRNTETKKIYESAKKEYDQYVNDIEWLINEVWDKVLEIRRKYERLSRLQNDYSEYLVLANNDEQIATAFLTKANTLSEADLAIVKGAKIQLTI